MIASLLHDRENSDYFSFLPDWEIPAIFPLPHREEKSGYFGYFPDPGVTPYYFVVKRVPSLVGQRGKEGGLKLRPPSSLPLPLTMQSKFAN